MKNFSFFALSLALVGTVVSCSKDNDDPKPKTKTELLTAKSWRLTAEQTVVVYNGKTTTEDGFGDYKACEKDNFLKFNSDKSLVADEGASKCSTSDAQTEKGTWDFNSDQTKLTFSQGGALSFTFDLADLSETTLKIKTTDTYDTDGDGKDDTTDTTTQTFTAF